MTMITMMTMTMSTISKMTVLDLQISHLKCVPEQSVVANVATRMFPKIVAPPNHVDFEQT